MADRVRKVSYCYVVVSRRAGQGAKVLGELKAEGINLLAFTGFPGAAGKAQLDLVVERTAPVIRLARRNGWRVSRPKKGFLIDGQDQLGVLHRHVARLAAANISVTAADAVSAGKGRYGMLLWVKDKDYNRAAKALKAK